MSRTSAPAPRTRTQATSLTQISTARAPRCQACGGIRVTQLSMTLTDGTPVSFASCHVCEHRSWSHEGRPLGIDTVLAKATKVRG